MRGALFSRTGKCQPPPTTTYANLNRYNLAHRPVNPDTDYAAAQVKARVTVLSGAATKASDLIFGAGENSAAPTRPANPIFLGPSDPQVGRVFNVTSRPYNAMCD